MSEADVNSDEDQLGGASILLATPDLKGYWPKLFAKAGIKVHAVDDVDEFAVRVETSPPPVLMIDLSIDKGGLVAIRDSILLKNMDSSMHLVGLIDTSIDNPEDEKISDAFEIGAQDFLIKGLTPESLSQRIRFIYRHAIMLQRMHSSDRSVFDQLREGKAHWIWDQEKDLVYVSDAMLFIMKAEPSERLVPMERFLSHFSAQQKKGFERAIEKTKGSGLPTRLFQIFSAGVLKGAVEHILAVQDSKDTETSRIIGVAKLREDQEKHRKVLFSRDRMTGLPNQEGLLVALDNILNLQTKKEGQYENGFLGLIVVDIDRFKRIAAVYGRKASDEAVRLIAKRLKTFIVEPKQEAREAAQKGDKTLLAKSKAVYLSCLGRDEFAFLITGLDRVDISAQLAGKIVKAFDEPFVIDGQEIYLSTSMGVTIAPIDGENGEILLKNARGALAQAKNQPASGYQFFSPALASSTKERMRIETKLRQAIDEDKLTISYQPQVDIASGKITGVEALARWDHPEFGAMSPHTFVAIAEEVGIVNELGTLVLRKSIADAQYFAAQGHELQLSVNVSTGMFSSGKLHNIIVKTLKDTKFDPQRLTLEITEGVVMKDIETAAEIMNVLKERGVKMALDDFGTGYSSLSYLKTLPFDTIKIDRSFVTDMVDSQDGAAMVKAIMDIAKNLNIDVTAEGVELKEQLEMLTREGCKHYQGYYCSSPVGREELLELLKSAK